MEANISTTALCDANEALFATGALRVLPPGWLALGRRVRFHSSAVTLKPFEDNSLLAWTVKTMGTGKVLIVDAGGSTRCAALGGNLAAVAANNQWQGVIVFGAVGDAEEIDACELGVRALALNARRSMERGEGRRDAAIDISGVPVRPGEWIYADRDGAVVSAQPLLG